ncbi:cation transporter [Streptomyces sp. x-19]|uniref:cation transporter n=1 Tax=Streptomyces sp. x-19 TaxID=2789280 RepID=UPI00398037AB
MTTNPTTAETSGQAAESTKSLDLSITGMTCASCAVRIERKPNKLPGVSASVNFATASAHVAYADGITSQDMMDVVQDLGYEAALPAPRSTAPTVEAVGGEGGELAGEEERHVRALRKRLLAMDTLVSLGVLAAWVWSVYALFLGGAGEPGMQMTVSERGEFAGECPAGTPEHIAEHGEQRRGP